MTTDPRVIQIHLSDFKIPKRLRGLRLGQDSHESPITQSFVDNIFDHYLFNTRRVIDDPPLEGIGRGLAFVGPPGSGKTTEAVKAIIEIYLREHLHVLFLAYPDYIAMRKEQWSLANKADHIDRWNAIQAMTEAVREVSVLLLDDIGKEHDGTTNFASKELDTLLRQRHRDGLPTVVTTNVPLSKWGETYSTSMGSFVQEAFTLVVMASDDQRKPERRAGR